MPGMTDEERQFVDIIASPSLSLKQVRLILGSTDKKQRLIVGDLILNLLHGTVDLSPEQNKILRKNKTGLRTIKKAKKRVSSKLLKKYAKGIREAARVAVTALISPPAGENQHLDKAPEAHGGGGDDSPLSSQPAKSE